MAQRKLNKNLVAFLTVMGMLLSIAVVAIATHRGTQRDPEVYAATARKHEESGDYERAIEYYKRAFDASRRAGKADIRYLTNAARCAYEMGEIPIALRWLQDAHSQDPQNMEVLQTLIERLWELRESVYATWLWEGLRDAAGDMLETEPKNVLALLARAESLRRLGTNELTGEVLDAAYARESEERMKQVLELAPQDPLVVEILADRHLAEIDALRAKARAGRVPADLDAKIEDARKRAADVLTGGLAANPGAPALALRLARVQLLAGQAAEARDTLARAIAANPADPILHLTASRFERDRLASEKLEADARREVVKRARELAARAVELEPALYDAYEDLVLLIMLDADPSADKQAELQRRCDAALAVLDKAIGDSLNLHSPRAMLNQGQRVLLFFNAFRVARTLHAEASDAAIKKVALERARGYVSDAKTQFPDAALTHFIEAELAIAERNYPVAIQSYQRAEERSRNPGGAPQLLNVMANENLALLYREMNEPGAAVRFGEAALAQYQQLRQSPPARLGSSHVQALISSGRLEKARDLAAEFRELYKNEAGFAQLQAEALAQLKKPDEAQRILATLGSDDVNNLYAQARIAASEKDWATAEAALVKALEKAPNRADLLRFYVNVMGMSDRRQAGLAKLAELKQNAANDEQKRAIEMFEVVLGTTDEQERNQKLLAIIEATPDEETRQSDLFTYYSQSGDLDKAAAALDRLAQLRTDDQAVLEQQFIISMKRQKLDEAEKLATRLAARNADLAGGARYRGQLALARQAWEDAVREFRALVAALPNDSVAHFNLGLSLLQGKSANPQEAVDAINRAIELNPNYLAAYKLLFEVYESRGQREAAVQALTQARRLAPNDPFVLQRAQLIEEETNPAAGIDRRLELRKTDPKNLDNLCALVRLYGRTKDYVRAEELIREAAAIDPASDKLLEAALPVLADARNREAGEKLINDYSEKSKPEGKVLARIRLARFYEALGDIAAARAMLEETDRLVPQLITDPTTQRIFRIETGVQLVEFLNRVNAPRDAVEAARRTLTQVKPGEVDRQALLRQRIAECLMKSGQFAEAEQEVNKFIQDYPNDARGRINKAQLALAQTQLLPAREALTALLQLTPNDVWALYSRGTVNLQLRRYGEAREDLIRAAELSKPTPTAPLNDLGLAVRQRLAALYENTGQIELAENEWVKLSELLPESTAIADRRISFYRNNAIRAADARQAADWISKAKVYISDSLGKYPRSPYWPFQLGGLFMQGQDYAAALPHFRTAYDLSGGNDPAVTTALMHCQIKVGKPADAIKLFESLKPGQITPHVRVSAADAYVALGQIEKATEQLDKAAYDAASTSNADLRYVVGRTAEKAKWEDIAVVLERYAADIPPTSIQSVRLRTTQAMCHLNHKAADKALVAIEGALAAAPPRTMEWIAAMQVKAQIQFMLNQRDAMIATYEQILREDPLNEEALNNIAYFLADFGRAAEALPYAARAAALAGDDANMLDTVGWVYYVNDRLDEAEAVLREALRLDPRMVPTHYHLGMALAKAGKVAEARAAFSEAIRRARESNDAEHLRKAEQELEKLK
jgi:tetratricopeptide (TPR) repeat protein